jgi:hypothetical protein
LVEIETELESIFKSFEALGLINEFIVKQLLCSGSLRLQLIKNFVNVFGSISCRRLVQIWLLRSRSVMFAHDAIHYV